MVKAAVPLGDISHIVPGQMPETKAAVQSISAEYYPKLGLVAVQTGYDNRSNNRQPPCYFFAAMLPIHQQ